MTTRVLVTAASKHGATQEIAEAIGRVLNEQGVETHVAKVDDVADLSSYDAVVLGSAVYMGHWLESARRFADEHADELAARRTWLFSSGPIGDPPRPEEAEAVDVDEIVAAMQAKDHRLFAGRIDRSKLGFAEHAVMRAVGTAEGDYRNWDEVTAWATGIAQALQQSPPSLRSTQ